MKRDIQTDRRMYNMLLDKAEQFQIMDRQGNEVTLELKPLQLGRLMMISDRLLDLDLIFDEEDTDAVQKMWKICAERTREVAEIVAIATLNTKEEIDTQLEERTELLMWSPSMTPLAFANILFHIVTQSYHADFISAIRSVRMLRVGIANETEADRIASMGDKPFSAR